MGTDGGGAHGERGDGGERGDVITSGLVKTLVVVLLIGLVLYEAGAVMVNRVQLDEAAQDAARAGVRALASGTGPADARAAEAARAAVDPDVTVEAVTVDADTVTVAVARPARTILLHRLGPLASAAQGSATASAGAPGS